MDDIKEQEDLHHYVLNGYGCTRNLEDIEAVYNLLEEIPKRLELGETATPPYVFPSNEKTNRGKGVSGAVILAETRGHITIHTFFARDFVRLDIFSGKEFCEETVVKLARLKFGFHNHDSDNDYY